MTPTAHHAPIDFPLPTSGRSVVAAQKPSKLLGRVRFPSPAPETHHGEWRSLVAHPAGGRAVAGSNPVSPMRERRANAGLLMSEPDAVVPLPGANRVPNAGLCL